jgi:hypothetical protein
MKTITKKQLFLVLGVIAMIAGFSQQGIARSAVDETPAADPNYSGEVLASASFRNGRGSIEIHRVTEDGIDGVAIVKRGVIGENFKPSRNWNGFAFPDMVSAMYVDMTGQTLPSKAYFALQNIEVLKAKHAAEESLASDQLDSAEDSLEPRAACEDISPNPSDYFYYDCYVHGAKSIKKSNVDDICLLTAAIDGNHGMQLSYKAINGTYYDNFHSSVKQGHYVAYWLRTGIRRTRKGHIYDASASDYSRYNIDGDYKLLGVYYALRACQDAVLNH